MDTALSVEAEMKWFSCLSGFMEGPGDRRRNLLIVFIPATTDFGSIWVVGSEEMDRELISSYSNDWVGTFIYLLFFPLALVGEIFFSFWDLRSPLHTFFHCFFLTCLKWRKHGWEYRIDSNPREKRLAWFLSKGGWLPPSFN